MAVLANSWAEAGDSVRILTFESAEATPHWPIDERVELVRLGPAPPAARRRRCDPAQRPSCPSIAPGDPGWSTRGRRVVHGPDQRPRARVDLGIRTPVIVAEHNDPHEERPGRAWAIARWLMYRRATRIVVLTRSAADYFRRDLRRRVVILPNPVVRPHGTGTTVATPVERERGRIVAMGRLVHQKGFDRLLEAFARIATSRPGWTVTIHGRGTATWMLVQRARRLGLTARWRCPA